MTGLLARHRRRGMGAFRLLFMLPQVVPLVAVGVTWRWLYGDDGLINETLGGIGLGGWSRGPGWATSTGRWSRSAWWAHGCSAGCA